MFSIGIDLGGTNTTAGIVDASGRLVAQNRVKTNRMSDCQELARNMADQVSDLLAQSGHLKSDIQSVGIGSPGLIDSRLGMVVKASNLNLDHAPLRDNLASQLALPVYLANDADAAAYGEFSAGCGKLYDSFVTITLGTGVGSGVILDGKIMTGHFPGGGELGHTVIQAGGYACNCGRHGCWEEYSSATALVREARKSALARPGSLLHALCQGNLEQMSARIPFAAARQGDDAALRLLDWYTQYLAVGIANVIWIFQPQAIALGGGISREGEYLLAMLRPKVAFELNVPVETLSTDLVTCELGNEAGIIGAAMLFKMPA